MTHEHFKGKNTTASVGYSIKTPPQVWVIPLKHHHKCGLFRKFANAGGFSASLILVESFDLEDKSFIRLSIKNREGTFHHFISQQRDLKRLELNITISDRSRISQKGHQPQRGAPTHYFVQFSSKLHEKKIGPWDLC